MSIAVLTALAVSQAGGAPDLPSGFEPPLARYASGSVEAPCMGTPLRIGWETVDDVNRLTTMAFGARSASERELRALDRDLRALAGQIHAQVACDPSGAIVTFRRTWPGVAAGKAGFVQILVTPKAIARIEM